MLSQQEMSDRLEIQDLLNAYCHAIDRRDWDALDQICSREDAIIDYTEAGGARGTLAGNQTLWLDKALKKVRRFSAHDRDDGVCSSTATRRQRGQSYSIPMIVEKAWHSPCLLRRSLVL